jgi:hypothetical protein
MAVEHHPSNALPLTRNQRLEGWKDKTEQEIFDYSLPPLAKVLASVSKRYGPGMSPTKWSIMMASVAGAYVLNILNRKPLVQKLREILGIPLPDPSQIYRPVGGKQERQSLLPWEAYMTKLKKKDLLSCFTAIGTILKIQILFYTLFMLLSRALLLPIRPHTIR